MKPVRTREEGLPPCHNCYWHGGGKEDQFPPNFGQRARAHVASLNQGAVKHFVLSVRVLDTLEVDDGGTNATVALISKTFQDFRVLPSLTWEQVI